MRFANLLKFGLASTAISGSLQSSSAASLISEPPVDENDPFVRYDRCVSRYVPDECQGNAGTKGAVILDRPGNSGRILSRFEYGRTVLLLEPASKLSSSEWLPIAIAVGGPRGPFTDKVRAWARREEVVLNSDFRRVVGCWPLRFVVVPEGEIEGHYGSVSFTVKGVARARSEDGLEGPDAQLTYYAGGIFTVRHPVYVTHDYFIAGTLDYGTRTVNYLGEKLLKGEKQVRWFGAKELEGCKQIPTVDDTRVPKRRWPEKERGG